MNSQIMAWVCSTIIGVTLLAIILLTSFLGTANEAERFQEVETTSFEMNDLTNGGRRLGP